MLLEILNRSDPYPEVSMGLFSFLKLINANHLKQTEVFAEEPTKYLQQVHSYISAEDEIPELLANLIRKCLSWNAQDRPEFEQIIFELDSLNQLL